MGLRLDAEHLVPWFHVVLPSMRVTASWAACSSTYVTEGGAAGQGVAVAVVGQELEAVDGPE